jgi:heme a synthase
VDPSPTPDAASARAFRRFAAFLLGYLLLVIVFGAWVRITGSGAGCGAHWPSCQGMIVPRSPSQATLIEYTHRLSSGLLGVLALALPLWAFRSFRRGHAARRWSLATLALVGVEAAIGAGLVKKQLVADDDSAARAVVVALHLVNTLLLTASAALTHASVRAARRSPLPVSAGLRWLVGCVLLGLALVAASGAVTALGDTLFPVGSSAAGAAAASRHFLVQLRVLHPILACALVCGVLALARHFLERARNGDPGSRPGAAALAACALAQLLLGAANVLMRAPGWVQLLHLLLAQLLWISAVLAAQRLRRSSVGEA